MGSSGHIARVQSLGTMTRAKMPRTEDQRKLLAIAAVQSSYDVRTEIERPWVELAADLKRDLASKSSEAQLDFSGADFRSLAFWGSRLFWRANLRGVNFAHSFFYDVDFMYSDLEGACFDDCEFYIPISFEGARLEGASFRRVRFHPSFKKATFRSICFDGAVFIGGEPTFDDEADLTGCSFVGSETKLWSDGSGKKDVRRFVARLSPDQKKQIIAPQSRCFIVTAASGGGHPRELAILQEYRDCVLERSWGGRAFIRMYEFLSPSIAAVVARSNTLKRLVWHMLAIPATSWAGRRLPHDEYRRPPS